MHCHFGRPPARQYNITINGCHYMPYNCFPPMGMPWSFCHNDNALKWGLGFGIGYGLANIAGGIINRYI